MKKRNQLKQRYQAPLSAPTEVAFEAALLVTTNRLTPEVDELENVNENASEDDMYFEF